MKKQIIILISLLLFVIGASFLINSFWDSFFGEYQRTSVSDINFDKKEYTITYTKKGFRPKKMAIPKNSTVTFKTKQDEYFWPASNIHPTHNLYSKFDPLEPIAPEDTWKFTFKKTGFFRFHDHLSPEHTGTIIVATKRSGVDNKPRCENIKNSSIKVKKRCWDYQISTTLETEGVEEAWNKITELYNEYPKFAEVSCHYFAHRLGEEYYAENPTYNLGDNFDLPTETTLCSYGFYHGWIEHLVRDHPNMERAKKFCENLTAELRNKIPRIKANCYHAMGHGFVKEVTQGSGWGNPEAILNNAPEKCHEVTSRKVDTSECLEGAYNGLAYWWWNNDYGLEFIEDPKEWLSFCERPEVSDFQEKKACYYEFGMWLLHQIDREKSYITEVGRILEDVENDKIAETVIGVASPGVIPQLMHSPDFGNEIKEYISQCQQLSERLQERCIGGLVGGTMAHGNPKTAYKKAVKICDSSQLVEERKQVCYKHVVYRLSTKYTNEKVQSICGNYIPAKYQKYCEK